MLPGKYHINLDNSSIYNISRTNDYTIIETREKKYKFDGYLIPGLADSHGHIAGLGQFLSQPDLRNAKSPEECVDYIHNSISLQNNWIVGYGWNQENWNKKDFPHKSILDKYFRDIPVFLRRVDGHAAWVNSKALDLCGITAYSKNPQGGEIINDNSGYPTGILIDSAMDLIRNNIPDFSIKQIEDHILNAINSLISHGVTYTHDMDVDPKYIPIFQDLDRRGKLKIRIDSYIKSQNKTPNLNNIQNSGNLFNIKGLKFYADGAFGSRGAALLKPYSDEPNNSGLLLTSDASLYKSGIYGVENNLNIATHAIGDKAARITLNAYNSIRNDYTDAILRIEHCQLIDPEDIERFADIGAIASVQPVHCTSDAASIAENRLGKRCNYAYPWKSLIDRGITVLGGSDFPIESHNPLSGIDAFVNRKPIGYEIPWQAHEIITLNDAIDAYSVNPRKINNISALSHGSPADFTILSDNLENDILETKILATFVDGRPVYLIDS